MFIDKVSGKVINIEKFKRRIVGLTSYFKSAQEKLLPRYDKVKDFHVVKIPMSDYQFKVYETARAQERKTEKSDKKKKTPEIDVNGVFKDPSSTYRIFSRLFCNFVMPAPPGRPVPIKFKPKEVSVAEAAEQVEQQEGGQDDIDDDEENIDEIYVPEMNYGGALSSSYSGGALSSSYGGADKDVDERVEEELEGDEILASSDLSYQQEIENAIQYLKTNSSSYLSKPGLETYSPKFLHCLENIIDPAHEGLHLVYSQFRAMEGIEIFRLTLEENGFTQFKLNKSSAGLWTLAIPEDQIGKPTYALYTGTEDAEEREIVRNIFNGSWDQVPNGIAQQLRAKYTNNNLGEVVKVFMITAAGSEGINLRCVRYVHVMEPYWHPVRAEQVIGRARRICSHTALPEALQTVEVFMYLMTFTKKQLESGDSIELKLKDLSKRAPYVPLTSDECLFEISNIKEEVGVQLLKGTSESSIDCATHYKSNAREGLVCMSFGNPSGVDYTYHPDYLKDENDQVATLNQKTITWTGKLMTFNGKQMVLRKDTNQVYDYDSYQYALANPGVQPMYIGTLEKKDGKYALIT